MSKKKEILKQVGLYSAATIVTQIITLAAGILTRRFLGPLQTGVWSALQIILQYTTHSQLGTVKAALREIPHYRGRGEPERAEEIKNLVLSFTFLSSSVIGVLIAVFALVMRTRLSPEIFYGLLFIALLVVLQRVHNLMVGLLRAYKDFRLASSQMVFSAVVNAVLIAALTYRFKIYGFMLAMCLSFAFNIAYLSKKHAYHFRWVFDRAKIRDLVAFGLPLIALNFLSTIFLSIDKLLISGLLGLATLGVYSVALMGYDALANFMASIGIVLMPHLQEKYGASEKAESLRNYLTKSTDAFCDLMPILIAAAWFLGTWGIHLFLPQFTGAGVSLKLLALSSFFLAIAQNYESFLIGTKNHLRLFPIMIGCSLLSLVLNLVMLRNGLGIAGVAAVALLAVFVRFSLTFKAAAILLHSRIEALKLYGLVLAKFSLMAAILILFAFFVGEWDPTLPKTLLAMAGFTAFYVPFFMKQNKEFGVLDLLREKWGAKSAA